MSVKEQPWFPFVSVALWGLGVFVLVLINTGNVLLAVLLGAVVAFISWRLDGARRRQDRHGTD